MRYFTNKWFICLLIMTCFMGLAWAEENQGEVERFKCNAPSKSEMEFDNAVIYAVGRAVMASRSDAWFSDVELCMFSWYVSDKFSLAGYTWTTHHALLRMMSADPEQFFDVIKKHNPVGYHVWRDTLDHAQLWLMSEKCPDPSPLQQALRSIDGFAFKDETMEYVRRDVLRRLITLRCEIPDEER